MIRTRRGFALILAVIFAGLMGAGFTATKLIPAPPSFHWVKERYEPSDRWIVDRFGRPLELERASLKERSLEWIELKDVTPHFIELLVQVEDKRFFEHFGFDWRAALGSVRDFLRGSGLRGASTFSMQLVKNLGGEKSTRTFEKFFLKLKQVLQAIRLELTWSKEEILEAYLNRVWFRGEVRGLRLASLVFFDRAADALTEQEAALLVAMVKMPSGSESKVLSRACRILGGVGCDSLRLSPRVWQARTRTLLPVYSARILEPRSSTKGMIRTTLDRDVQSRVVQVLRDQLIELKNMNVQDAAAVVLETSTGRVLAYVGNGGPGATSAVEIDGIMQKRQLGSTIKPFVYASAFELGVIKTNTLLFDSKEDLSVGGGRVYHPRNYDNQFRGHVSAAEALASSLNVPAVRVLDLVGEARVIGLLSQFGFDVAHDDDHYGPSLALGTLDASLWELTQAYRRLSVFADQGESQPPLSANTKRQIFNSLALSENRRFTFGLGSALELPFPAAVKTGTSKDMRDNWCLGFTGHYTVGVWVGNFSGAPMWNVSGMTGAAPLWRSIMLALHKNLKPKDEVPEYTSPGPALPIRTISRIRYPVNDMLIGVDPDIPEKNQKVRIQVEGALGSSLRLNGQTIKIESLKLQNGESIREVLWSPRIGSYRLELVGNNGEQLDQVRFIVR